MNSQEKDNKRGCGDYQGRYCGGIRQGRGHGRYFGNKANKKARK